MAAPAKQSYPAVPPELAEFVEQLAQILVDDYEKENPLPAEPSDDHDPA